MKLYGPSTGGWHYFQENQEKKNEKSHAAAASEAQLWHGKGPAARPMDRSLQCKLNSEHRGSRGHSTGGHGTAVRIEPLEHCIQHI